MKKFVFIPLMLIVAMFAGCEDTQIDKLSVTPDELEFEANDIIEQSVDVNTNVKHWSASTSDKWITIEEYEGSERFAVSVESHSGSSNRSGKITVKAGNAEPVTVTVTQKAQGSSSSIAYNTAVGYYFGDYYDTGTANFVLDMYNASNENIGVWIDAFHTLPSNVAGLNITGMYSAASTGAAFTFLKGEVNDGVPEGSFVYDLTNEKLILITGGSFAVIIHEGRYSIATNFTGVDYGTGASVSGLRFSFLGPIVFQDESGGSNGGGGSLSFGDIQKGTYTATAVPSYLEKPGPATWTGAIEPKSNSQNRWYELTNWGGATCTFYLDFIDGKIILDDYTKIADSNDNRDVYFGAGTVNGTNYTKVSDYEVKYNKATQTLDFSGTSGGRPVLVGLIGKNKTTNAIEAVYSELYADAKLKLTFGASSSQVKSHAHAGKNETLSVAFAPLGNIGNQSAKSNTELKFPKSKFKFD